MSNGTSVTTVVDHVGTLYIYATQTDGLVRKSRTATGSTSQTTISIDDSDITSEAGVAVVVAPPSSAAPEGKRVVFFLDDSGRGRSYVDGGSRVASLGVQGVKSSNGIGAASLAAGAVAAIFDSNGVNVGLWDWDGLLAGSPSAGPKTTLRPSGYTPYGGSSGHNGSNAAITAFVDGEGTTRLFLASSWKKSDGTVHVLGHVIDATCAQDGDVVTCSALSGVSAGLDRSVSGVPDCLGVLQRPDGRLMVWWRSSSGVEQMLVTPTSGNDWFDDWSHVSGSGDVPALGHYVFPCALAFLPAAVHTSSSSVAAGLIDAQVDIYDGLFNQDDDDIDSWIDSSRFGTVRRTAQAPQPQAQMLALGVIYGPPPVPVENINLPTDQSSTTPVATVSFSQTSSTSSGMTAKLGGAVFGRIGGSLEESESLTVLGFTIASFKLRGQLELSMGVSLYGTWSSTSSSSITSTIEAELTLAGRGGATPSAPGDWTVQQVGQVVGLSTSWASFVYDFVDKNGHTPANALSFAVVFPYQPTIALTPFVIPASAKGPHPGDLGSYVRTTDELQALDRRAHKVGGVPYLSGSWAVGSTARQSASTYDESSWNVDLGLDLGVLLGASAALDVLGTSGGVNGDVSFKGTFTYTWSRGSGSGAEFSSYANVPGNTSASGSYAQYNYRAYLLAESADNLSAIPAGSTGAGGLVIQDGSTPWLITYAVISASPIR